MVIGLVIIEDKVEKHQNSKNPIVKAQRPLNNIKFKIKALLIYQIGLKIPRLVDIIQTQTSSILDTESEQILRELKRFIYLF